MTEHDEEKRRNTLLPLKSIPPIAVEAQLDLLAETGVEVSDLCDRAGIRYRVTGGNPPLVVLREGGGHSRVSFPGGRERFVVDTSELRSEEPDRALRILELLVRAFGCYEAERSICNRGYFSPDIVTTYSGHVVVEGDDD